MIPADALWLAYISKPIKNTNLKSKEKTKETQDIPMALTRWKRKVFPRIPCAENENTLTLQRKRSRTGAQPSWFRALQSHCRGHRFESDCPYFPSQPMRAFPQRMFASSLFRGQTAYTFDPNRMADKGKQDCRLRQTAKHVPLHNCHIVQESCVTISFFGKKAWWKTQKEVPLQPS